MPIFLMNWRDKKNVKYGSLHNTKIPQCLLDFTFCDLDPKLCVVNLSTDILPSLFEIRSNSFMVESACK